MFWAALSADSLLSLRSRGQPPPRVRRAAGELVSRRGDRGQVRGAGAVRAQRVGPGPGGNVWEQGMRGGCGRGAHPPHNTEMAGESLPAHPGTWSPCLQSE